MALELEVLEKLDHWANALIAPAELRFTPEGEHERRLEFRHQTSENVMVGKLVRAVSGFRGALALAQVGHITECGVVLRSVSDFCTEISAIAASKHHEGGVHLAVKEFVQQYYVPRSRTPEEFDERERPRYVAREKLMRAFEALAEPLPIDMERLKRTSRFLKMIYDSYTHGAYETTMELWNPQTRSFEIRGHPSPKKRGECVDAVFQMMPEVVMAVEMTASVTGNSNVFRQARRARRAMEATEPWAITETDRAG